MNMTLSEMRCIINNTQLSEQYEVFTETAIQNLCDTILDEAYYGKKVVQPIIDAMTACCEVLYDNPTENMMSTRENKNLENAIKKVFGFKSVNIMWENRGTIVTGAYTYVGTPTTYGYKPGFKYGTHKDGFYDESHSLPVYIELSNNLVSDAQLTPEEMTAVLIHEIGHNFDFTPYTMLVGWVQAYLVIIAFIAGLENGTWVKALLSIFKSTDIGRAYSQIMANLDNIIMNYVPPIGLIGRGINRLGSLIIKFIGVIFSPLSVFSIPVALINAPMMYVISFFSRKKEIFADTFAASYGLGTELGTGLAKLDIWTSRMNTDQAGTLAEIFYDFSMFSREFICAFCDPAGHGNVQQRMIKARAKLEMDLKNNDVNPSLKNELKAQLASIDEAYEDYLRCDEYDRKVITSFFRSCIDRAYGGKDYMLIPSTKWDYAN